MQRQWTIEARVDFSDPEKNALITEAIRRAAVHIHAQLSLLQDVQKPQVVAFSDDYYTGHEEIALMSDTLGKTVTSDSGSEPEDTGISAELLQAVKDMK